MSYYQLYQSSRSCWKLLRAIRLSRSFQKCWRRVQFELNSLAVTNILELIYDFSLMTRLGKL